MKNRIAVVGVGKLGLCFALNLERAGYEVWGVETNEAYANALSDRTFESDEPEVNGLLRAAESFHVSTDISCVVEQDIEDIFIMVATPSTADGGYDHSQIERVTERLIALATHNSQPATRNSQLIARNLYIGCTTMPGYCVTLAEKLRPFGYTVSYNPEFIAQGSIIRDQLQPDQVLIGEATTEVGDRLQEIYQRMVHNSPTYCRMDPLSAEIAKLATNCFLTTKISFANSIGDLAIKAGADPEKILAAVGSDSRIGSKYLKHGFGFGGPCFPRDNRALGKYAEEMNYPLIISNATDEVNDAHFKFQLKQYLKDSEHGREVVFDGVAYKKGTAQITESQQLRLAAALAEEGRKVIIHDTQDVIDQVELLHPHVFRFESKNVVVGS